MSAQTVNKIPFHYITKTKLNNLCFLLMSQGLFTFKNWSLDVIIYFTYSILGSSKHPVTKLPRPSDRGDGVCLLSSLIALQLVAHIPGRRIPLVLWENIYLNSVISLRPLRTR